MRSSQQERFVSENNNFGSGERTPRKASRDYYKLEIESTRLELEQLKSDPAVLEKYAREKYRMKRDNEDVFILSDSTK